jgi:transposase
MEREDGRKLTKAAQEERRKMIVRLRKQGKTLRSIEEAVGLSHTAVCKTLRNHKKEGKSGLSGKARGRKLGEARHLSADQEDRIRGKIIDRRPEQLKMDFALWTREAVRQLILQDCKIDMPIRTVGEYLKRWGFTPQRPVKFASERQPGKVKEWLDKTFPDIRDRAAKENAKIYWADETGLRTGDVRGRGYAPRGKSPVVSIPAKHDNLSMVSAITNKGKVHWMIVEGAVNADRFIEFLDGLRRDTRGKVFLILDNLKVHHSKPVKEWLEKWKDRIEFFYLPSYSPDLNPDEHLNAELKQGIGSKAPSRTKERLSKAASEHMAMLKDNPKRIKEYFKDPVISYAAMRCSVAG